MIWCYVVGSFLCRFQRPGVHVSCLRVDTDQDQEPALRGRLLQLSWYDENKAVVPGPRSALHAGSVWQLHVRLRAPHGLMNPGGFDSERYALAQGIVATG